MTIHYVNSAAAGANNGTSKTDAWTSLASAVGVAAGDAIWISHTHNQNPGAGGSYNFSNGTTANPVLIFSVNFSTDAYTPAGSAQFSGALSDMSILGNVQVFGLNISVADDMSLGNSGTAGVQVYEDCAITAVDQIAISGTRSLVRFINCDWTWGGNTDFNLASTDGMRIEFIGCDWTGTGTTFISAFGARGGIITYDSCDLSIFSSMAATINGGWDVIIRGCKVHASAIGNFGGTVDPRSCGVMEYCQDGTITVPPLGLSKFAHYAGAATTTLARYRTGGADDGFQANPFSVELATNANALEIYNPLKVDISQYVAAADGSISGATARRIFSRSRVAPLGTPAACDTDGTSTWNGSGVGTKQQISVVLTNGATLTWHFASGGTLNDDDVWVEVSEPDQTGGLLEARVCLAKPSTTIYIDPVPTIT